MEYRFWKLKKNPVWIVKYHFGFININNIISSKLHWVERLRQNIFKKLLPHLPFNLGAFVLFYWLKWKRLPRAFQPINFFWKIPNISKVIMEKLKS